VLLAVIALTVVASPFVGRWGLIAWHAYRMRAAFGKAGTSPGGYFQRYEESREKLVDLGYLARKEFRLKHILVPSEESHKFWSLSLKVSPGSAHITMSGDEPETPDALIVWDRPDRMTEWERFVSKYDVPDYRERLDQDFSH